MRYFASEKLEIIRTVETSHLPVRRTLDKIGEHASHQHRYRRSGNERAAPCFARRRLHRGAGLYDRSLATSRRNPETTIPDGHSSCRAENRGTYLRIDEFGLEFGGGALGATVTNSQTEFRYGIIARLRREGFIAMATAACPVNAGRLRRHPGRTFVLGNPPLAVRL